MKRTVTGRLIQLPLVVTLFVSGCSQQPGLESTDTRSPGGARSGQVSVVDGSPYRLDEEPTGAQDVIAARESVQDGEQVVITGRIGGSENPWVEGRAAFSIVDASLKACSDIPGDDCATPWDYCCETHNLPSATAMVKVVDEQGDMVPADARDLLDVKELSTVVIRGEAVRDEAGNLTVLADGVYVRS